MNELDFLVKLAGAGGNGVLFGALVLLGRWYLPRLDKIVEHLGSIAVALAQLNGEVAATKQRIGEVSSDVADVKEDMSGLYAVVNAAQPSRTTRRLAPGGARG